MLAVDGHAADRVEQHDVVDDRLSSTGAIGAPPATVAGPGDATKSARPRRTWTSSARIESAISAGVSAPRSMPAGARSAASRSRRARPPRGATSRTTSARVGDATRPDVGGIAGERRSRRPPRPRRPASRRRRTARAPGRGRLMSAVRDDAFRAREGVGVRDRVDDGDPPARGRAEGRERAGDRRGAGDPEDRRGQMRFHVDLQGPAGVAGHDELDDAVAATALGRRVLRQPEQPGLAVAERAQRLADHDGLGAALPPTQPSMGVPSGWTMPDAPGRAEVGRSDRHDRGDRERPSPPPRARRRARRWTSRPSARISGDLAEMPFSCRIAQTFCGVIGMSMLRTPRCHRASTTAFAMAGGAPTVADSPTPLAPIG